MNKTVKVRFAPSPTGRLHIGNIRPAVFNWLFARREGGTFLLRFDDTDLERSKEEYVEGVREDLRWLGPHLGRGVPSVGALRFLRGDGGKAQKAGRLYACYETAEELERRRKRQMARGLPPVYDRAALKLTEEEKKELEAAGRKPHWRFLLEHRPTAWDDLIRGPQEIDAGSVSDPVLVREDGTPLYTFTSVADDADVGITHIIRGEDHVTNTAVQIQIFEALGARVPVFAHHNLLTGAQGEALSKRLGSLSIQGLREEGLEPLAVMTHASLIGTSEALHPQESLEALAKLFDFAKGLARTRPLRPRGVERLEREAAARHALRQRRGPAQRKGHRRRRAVLAGGAREFGGFCRCGSMVGSRSRQDKARHRGCRLHGQGAGAPAARALGYRHLVQWTEAVKRATGAKGRALYHPLRLALTGLERGPELKDLLPLIGHKKAAARLAGKMA